MLDFRRNDLAGLVGSLLVLASIACMSQASQTYRQQSQQNEPPKYFNDLVPSTGSIEIQSPTLKSMTYGASAQVNQINDKRTVHQALKSGPRAVINGNHATYVEPPANFKPIIYEYSQVAPSAQSPQHQQQQPPRTQQPATDPFESPATSSGSETFLESPNHLVASMLSPISGQGLSRQQQKRQTQAQRGQTQQQVTNDQRAISADQQDSDANAASSDEPEADDEPNLLPMKPSIDRWSDWHDMSVDPDLASSETQLSPARPLFKVAQSNQQRKAERRQQPPQQQQQQQQLHHHQQGRSPVTNYEQRLDKVQPQQESNGVLVANQQNENHQPLEQRFQVVPLINQLYHQQQQQQRILAANLIKMQQFPDSAASPELKQDYFYQAQPPHSHLPPSTFQQQLPANRFPLEQNLAYHQRPSSSPQAQSFYYTQQQNEQQQHQQQPPSPLMARSSFVPVNSPAMLTVLQHHPLPRMVLMQSQSAPNNKKMTNLFKAAADNQRLLVPSTASLKHARKLKTPPANAEVKLVANRAQVQKSYANQQQLSAPLVLNSPHHEVPSGVAHSLPNHKQVGASLPYATARILTPQLGNVAQRTPKPSLQAVIAPVNNSSAAQKRVLKRRRIKTLLPVGLSSWFLGGIRDLDARHWKLPSEVMNKLAINDVDLQHPETNQISGQPLAPIDPTAVINISNQVQPGGSLEKADQPRATSTRSPSSQMSPR